MMTSKEGDSASWAVPSLLILSSSGSAMTALIKVLCNRSRSSSLLVLAGTVASAGICACAGGAPEGVGWVGPRLAFFLANARAPFLLVVSSSWQLSVECARANTPHRTATNKLSAGGAIGFSLMTVYCGISDRFHPVEGEHNEQYHRPAPCSACGRRLFGQLSRLLPGTSPHPGNSVWDPDLLVLGIPSGAAGFALRLSLSIRAGSGYPIVGCLIDA